MHSVTLSKLCQHFMLPSTTIVSIPIFADVIVVFLPTCINIFHVIIICLYISLIYSFLPQHFTMKNFKHAAKMKNFYKQHCMSSSRLDHYHLFSLWIFTKGPGYESPLLSVGISGTDKTGVPTLSNQSI